MRDRSSVVSRQSSVGNWEKIGFVQGNGTTTKPQAYSYIDNNITTGKYKYRLKQIDFNGSFKYSKIVEVKVGVPLQFSLSQNYPNPFNPETKINYTIPKTTNVIIKVYDIIGREVKELVNERKQPGKYTVNFDASRLPSGVYIYTLHSESFISSKKMILLK